MSNIDELQRRITSAMDRIASSVSDAGAAEARVAAELASALEDEKRANAQLTERLQTLKDRCDGLVRDAKAADEAEARYSSVLLTILIFQTTITFSEVIENISKTHFSKNEIV